eukprot:TRINITY_DN13053_c0_g1_i2.p1 TRINITY_DN13053_c0_g1~~TRINITY_DN13053_c0_g1_i2.p1  ORF type:complete len:445 (-),score=52.58 TRINITY_DN13053_c0_g1_i2:65-1399(-)
MELFKNIDAYLGTSSSGIESYMTGDMLCLTVIACWSLMVLQEILKVLDLLRGLISIPHHGMEIMRVVNDDRSSHYELASLSRCRLALLSIIITYRVFFCILVLYGGVLFLVNTIKLEDLILNAVALEVILHVDKLIFHSLSATPAKHLVSHLAPIKMKQWPRWYGLDVKAATATLLLPIMLCTIYYGELKPIIADVTSVSSELCGGNHDFVWSPDARNVAIMSPTEAVQGAVQHMRSKAQAEAVKEAISMTAGRSQPAMHAIWMQDANVLSFTAAASLSERIDETQPNCMDLPAGRAEFKYMQELTGNTSLRECKDLLPGVGVVDGDRYPGMDIHRDCWAGASRGLCESSALFVDFKGAIAEGDKGSECDKSQPYPCDKEACAEGLPPGASIGCYSSDRSCWVSSWSDPFCSFAKDTERYADMQPETTCWAKAKTARCKANRSL